MVLANYANQHVPFVIRAMKAGRHVVSGVPPAQNLKECVELIETVQETGMRYFDAEDFCYFPATKKRMSWWTRVFWGSSSTAKANTCTASRRLRETE